MCAYCRYDIEAVRSVRQFRGHTDRITDLRMSADARWLLSSSLDGTLRVWDVPSARCLQVSPYIYLTLHSTLCCWITRDWHALHMSIASSSNCLRVQDLWMELV